MQNFTLPYPPSVNRLYATVGRYRVLTREGRQYKKDAADAAMAQGVKLHSGALAVCVHFFRPRKSGDLDNLSKSLLDSLKGIAWDDDAQITELHFFRHEDKENPRAEIEISAAYQEHERG